MATFSRRRTFTFGIILVGFVFVSTLVAQRNTPPNLEPSFVLERGRAGQFAVGMFVDEVYQLLGERNVRLVATFPEGFFQEELEMQLPGFTGGPALTAPIREWPCRRPALWGIRVHDPRFRTKNGLGVGSTFGDLKRLYGANLTVVANDGGPIAGPINEPGLTFVMESQRTYTDTARVSSIWVYGDPAETMARRCPDQ